MNRKEALISFIQIGETPGFRYNKKRKEKTKQKKQREKKERKSYCFFFFPPHSVTPIIHVIKTIVRRVGVVVTVLGSAFRFPLLFELRVEFVIFCIKSGVLKVGDGLAKGPNGRKQCWDMAIEVVDLLSERDHRHLHCNHTCNKVSH